MSDELMEAEDTNQLTEAGELLNCRQALDSAVEKKDWKDIFTMLLLLVMNAKSEPTQVRAADLLLRYRFGPPAPQPRPEEEVEPIKIIEICSAEDRPEDE